MVFVGMFPLGGRPPYGVIDMAHRVFASHDVVVGSFEATPEHLRRLGVTFGASHLCSRTPSYLPSTCEALVMAPACSGAAVAQAAPAATGATGGGEGVSPQQPMVRLPAVDGIYARPPSIADLEPSSPVPPNSEYYERFALPSAVLGPKAPRKLVASRDMDSLHAPVAAVLTSQAGVRMRVVTWTIGDPAALGRRVHFEPNLAIGASGTSSGCDSGGGSPLQGGDLSGGRIDRYDRVVDAVAQLLEEHDVVALVDVPVKLGAQVAGLVTLRSRQWTVWHHPIVSGEGGGSAPGAAIVVLARKQVLVLVP